MGLFRRRRGDPGRAPAGETLSPGDALARADDLEAAGHFEQAIALLTQANRACRDRQVEARLIDLRSLAFQEAEWSFDPPPLPGSASIPDRFPGELIPEVAAADFDIDVLRSAMTHHGSIIVRGLVDPSDAARLRDHIESALHAFDATVGEPNPECEGWYRPFTRDNMSDRERKRMRGSILTVESPPAMFDLVETFHAVGVDAIVTEYFGERPVLLGRKATLRKIAHDTRTGGWHQDGAFMGVGVRSLNVWLPLTHCGDTAPGMDVVGKPLDYIVETGEGFAPWATSPAAAEAVAEGALVRPIFDPGDALLFDQMNLHRTAVDPGMTEDRHAIETWFLSPSTYDEMMRTNDEGYSPRDQIPILF